MNASNTKIITSHTIIISRTIIDLSFVGMNFQLRDLDG
jgi:hypothetical protein